MKDSKLALLTILLGLAILQLVGCASTTKPTPMEVNISASPNLNPNIFGRPSPVYVTLLQLKDIQAFSQADYFTLAEQASLTLGDNLITENTFLVIPSLQKSIDLNLDPQARYLGVIVAYDQLDAATWRTVLPVSNATDKLLLKVNANNVNLIKE